MAKTYVSFLFVFINILVVDAGATGVNRRPGSSTSSAKNYVQMLTENPTDCAFASKATRSPFDNVGTCTTQSCREITLESRSFGSGLGKAR